MTSPERPPFPDAWDSTMVAALKACPQRFYRNYVQHWKPKGESVHLVAGAAYAKGLEIARRAFYEHSRPAAECVAEGAEALIQAYGDFECPKDSAKSLERTVGALEFYFDQYPLGRDGAVPLETPSGRAIEFSFAYPIEVNHPVTGMPLLYCGRQDMVARFADGNYGEDDKTTSSLGASWSRQWEMRSQFTGYAWANTIAGFGPKGTIIRGVSILKTKYETQQAITYRPAWEIERWYVQLVRELERAKVMWTEGYWDYDLSAACTEYGGCPFVTACKSREPEVWLPMYFEQRVWSPIDRTEKPLVAPAL